MKTREISEAIGMSESTVKANLVKGRKKIEQEVLQLAKKHGLKINMNVNFQTQKNMNVK